MGGVFDDWLCNVAVASAVTLWLVSDWMRTVTVPCAGAEASRSARAPLPETRNAEERTRWVATPSRSARVAARWAGRADDVAWWLLFRLSGALHLQEECERTGTGEVTTAGAKLPQHQPFRRW